MTETENDSVSFGAFLGRLSRSAVAIGATGGAIFVGMDLVTNRVNIPAAEVVQMILCTALAGVVVIVPICIAAGLACRTVLRTCDASIVAAAMSGIVAQCILGLMLEGKLAVAALPVPWLLAGAVYRANRCAQISRGVARAAATFMTMVLGVAAVALAHVRWGVGAAGISAAIAFATVLLLRRGSRKLACAAAAPLLLLLGLSQLLTHDTAWQQFPLSPVPSATRPATTALPNVVLIVLDTARADRLGCYGSREGLTPHIDALAAQGTIYQSMFAPSPWTVPSHASLFTGLYPLTHGCDTDQHRWLDDGFDTLAEMLAGIGYQTVSLSANDHLEVTNLLQGFNDRLDLLAERKPTWMYAAVSRLGFPAKWSDKGGAQGVAALSDWLAHSRNPKRPFFLFVNLMETHWPHNPPLAWRRPHLPPDVSYLQALRTSDHYYGIRWLAGQSHSRSEEETIRGLYAAGISYDDEIVEQMLSQLRGQIDLDQTMVMITADHGENLGDGGRWDHVFAVNDALIHVPMIVRYPLRFTAGSRVSGACQLVDIVPTVFDVLGRPCPVRNLPGRTIVPDRFEPRQFVISQFAPYYGHLERMQGVTGLKRDVAEFTAQLRAIRNDRFKFVWSSRGDHRLYDLNADPDERESVMKKRSDVATELEKTLQTWWSQQPPYVARPGGEARPLNDKQRSRLEQNGYLSRE